MDLNIAQHLPPHFADTSKVWVYQASRQLMISEALQLDDMFKSFTEGWQSHGDPVKGAALLLFGRFVILMADETQTSLGGCSTDSSLRFIKSIEQKFSIQLLNRQLLAFIVKDKIETLPLAQLEHAIQNNFIGPDTLYFNNTLLTKAQLINEWIVPASQSWLAGRFASLEPK